MRTVTIDGKQYDVKFNMGVAANYELRYGKKLDEFLEELKQVIDGGLGFSNLMKLREMVNVILDKAGAPSVDDIENINECAEVITGCLFVITDYFKPHKGDDLNTTVPDESSSASDSPN